MRLESPSEDNLLLPSLAFLEEDRRRSVVEELLALLESSKITFSELLSLLGSRTAPSISVIWAMVRASEYLWHQMKLDAASNLLLGVINS